MAQARRSIHTPTISIILAVALTMLFFGRLWLGGGLVGGDVYSYSLPQKTFLADRLQAGEIPLWNPLVGQGYPVLGESQTGAVYPLHWLAYGWLETATAWSFVLIVHYIAAFLGMAWCARQIGLTLSGSLLAAVVYVYGWFPPRAFLDWAILGGVYLPLVIGCTQGWFVTKQPRYLIGLSFSLGLQLLGGHYQIAFLTWLLWGAFVGWMFWFSRSSSGDAFPASHRQNVAWVAIAFALGVGLAAVQLLPTWELKTRSQRADVGGEHDPGYGHIPPLYLSQMVLPWVWYDPAIDQDAALNKLTWLRFPSGTNRVEAYLYFGLLPLAIAVMQVVSGLRNPAERPMTAFWLIIAVLSVIYTTGWLMPLLQSVPGFNFFRGPGRAGILTTFAIALLAGQGSQRMVAMCGPRWSWHIIGLVLSLTVADLWWLPRTVSYAVTVSTPPIRFRDDSPFRKTLLAEPQPVRLYAPGPNLPTLLGVSAVPVYLGLGPSEYFDPQYQIPPVIPDDFHAYSAERVDWLRDSGVTHILSFEPLESRGWPVEFVQGGFDPLLNPAWGRFGEPIYLYRLLSAPGRVAWVDADATAMATITSYAPHRVEVTATSETGGELVLKDLNFPGWQTWVNGALVTDAPVSGRFRAVKLSSGVHQLVWCYRPRSVYWGAVVSGLSCLGLAAIVVTLRRQRSSA
ncbi:hypothetical protein GC163_21655 [bacterium]|nr:hypothetical protein [bacterium]